MIVEMLQLHDIVRFWQGQRRTANGRWVHPDDEKVLTEHVHSFNLDYPVSPYVGDVVNAPVIILGANAGYSPGLTDAEFQDDAAIGRFLERVRDPAAAAWSSVHQYYQRVNYGPLITQGRAVLVNACAYRSRRLSEERDNQALINILPSVIFVRRWLIEAVLPAAQRGERLVVGKRPGQWKLPPASSVVFDPAPVSPNITREPWLRVERFLSSNP